MKKWFIRLAILLLVVVGGLFFFAKSYMTRNYVVEKLEKSINSRVQVGELKVSLFGEVELVNVVITERDENADNKTPHDDREALADGKLMIDSVKFRLSFGEIISRKLSIESIDLDGLVAKLEILEDGSLDVEALFDKPDKKEKKKGEKKKRFNAKDHDDFVTEIKEINLTNINADLIVSKTQLLLKARIAELKVSDIRVNPKQLETVNDARIKISCDLELFSLDNNTEYGKLGITGDTTLTIFNTESGDLEPDMKIDLVLSSDSYLTTKIPLISKVWDKVLKSLDVIAKITKDKVTLSDRVEFRDNQKVELTYKLGKIDLLDTFAVHMSDWEINVIGGSFFNTVNDLHRVDLKLYVTSKISKRVSALLDKSKAMGKLLGKLTGGRDKKEDSKESWMEGDRMFLLAESTGSTSRPKIKIKNGILGSMQGRIEGLLDDKNRDKIKQGADLLKGFLK